MGRTAVILWMPSLIHLGSWLDGYATGVEGHSFTNKDDWLAVLNQVAIYLKLQIFSLKTLEQNQK